MTTSSGQKIIGRNRAPRVQIEYDVEVYGSEKNVQLPFVMGVLADLSGKPVEKLEPVADRSFLDIDVDNFDDRLKSMKPRVATAVRNTLTDDGNLNVDITFESMDDFSPAAIARKVEPLRKLLETRTQLANLMTYMDGKSGAEDMIAELLQNATMLQALASSPNPQTSETTPSVPPTTSVAASDPAAPESGVNTAAAGVDLDSMLDDLGTEPTPAGSNKTDDDLDSLLGDLGGNEKPTDTDKTDEDDLDSLLNDL